LQDSESAALAVVSLTGDPGRFGFFTSGNVEMTVKVVDGRAVP